MSNAAPNQAGALAVTDVVKRFGEHAALDHVSFTVRAGELFGLVGPDGAGKTTTIRTLAGLLGVNGGSVRVLGHDPLHSSTVRDALGVMPQHYSLYGDLSVEENLQFFSRMYCLRAREYRERSRRLLELTRLSPFVARRASALSGGMYKKLALACALLHEPSVLLLDEPTNGVDPVSRRDLWELLHGFVAQGMAVLIATAYMDEAARCHRVGLLHHGRMLAVGEPDTLVAALPHPVYEVVGGPRRDVQQLAERDPGVLAASPAGERLRLVVDRRSADRVEQRISALGSRLCPVTADFEDLFLVSTRDAPGSETGAQP
jgi:ABC-2 type transport system ATP-binding protein